MRVNCEHTFNTLSACTGASALASASLSSLSLSLLLSLGARLLPSLRGGPFVRLACFLACGSLVDECDALDLHGDLPTSNIFVTAAVHNRAHVRSLTHLRP